MRTPAPTPAPAPAPTPVRATEARRTETPNATMTTLASPTLGDSTRLSLWEVAMPGGAQGPRHTFDSEQLWTIAEGELRIELDGTAVELQTGDTLALPAGAERRITAVRDTRALVCGHGDAVVRVAGEDTTRGTPPWIA